jgi:hypothetical protein
MRPRIGVLDLRVAVASTPARPHAPLAGVPPLAQAARNRVSVLVEFAGDPPVLVTQFALCNIRQLLLAHVSAVR